MRKTLKRFLNEESYSQLQNVSKKEDEMQRVWKRLDNII
jgi:hypothetical protein